MRQIAFERLPCPEEELREALAEYKAALVAHSATVGRPAPEPRFEFLRDFVRTDFVNGQVVAIGDFEVVDLPPPPPPPPTLAQLKTVKGYQINTDRDRAIAGAVTYLDVPFDCDDRSRTNLTGAITAFKAGVPVPQNFVWRSADNRNIPMALDDLVGLAAAMLAHVNSIYTLSWSRKAALEAASTPEDIEAA